MAELICKNDEYFVLYKGKEYTLEDMKTCFRKNYNKREPIGFGAPIERYWKCLEISKEFDELFDEKEKNEINARRSLDLIIE